MAAGPTPRAWASRAKIGFQASKPAPVLPHGAARAAPDIVMSAATRAATPNRISAIELSPSKSRTKKSAGPLRSGVTIPRRGVRLSRRCVTWQCPRVAGFGELFPHMTVQRRQRSRRHRFASPRLLGGFGNLLEAGEIFLDLQRRH